MAAVKALNGRGNYQTRQMDVVLNYFKEAPDKCSTIEKVYRTLADEGVSVGETTVYRAVARLFNAGVLCKYPPPEKGEGALYQYNTCKGDHLHIRCISCGLLAHLPCTEAQAFSAHLLEDHGFRLDEAQTVLYGICEKCTVK